MLLSFLFIYFTGLETEAQKKAANLPRCHIRIIMQEALETQTSFSEPAMILQTLFWHLIHCNLNTALINLLFPKESLNLQISILFMEELFIIFFLFFTSMMYFGGTALKYTE